MELLGLWAARRAAQDGGLSFAIGRSMGQLLSEWTNGPIVGVGRLGHAGRGSATLNLSKDTYGRHINASMTPK